MRYGLRFFGLAIGLLVPSESAVGIANGVLVVFSFFGTLFAPLTKDLMPYARFTPLYGAAEISRYPFTQGSRLSTAAAPTGT
ncbi:hypothetical protein [Rothia dentocariosa]|uniref:hypothetical protein n=1 Tax=Rothia dentocariosa TaxID=2047 RepID=UPI000E048A2A|nr:hypothetical protein [Rothia dentocariosa]SUE45168.1 Uncharacterised protein [Rothia dentocariosa]